MVIFENSKNHSRFNLKFQIMAQCSIRLKMKNYLHSTNEISVYIMHIIYYYVLFIRLITKPEQSGLHC